MKKPNANSPPLLKEDASEEEDDSSETEEDFEQKSLVRLVEKSVEVSEKLAKENSLLRKKLSALETRIAKDKSYPEDDVEVEGKENHDPTQNEEQNESSEEGDTKPAHATTSTKGAFTKARPVQKGLGAGLLQKALKDQEKAIMAAVDAKFKAYTPIPAGFTPETWAIAKNPFSLVQKAIAEERGRLGLSTTGARRASESDKIQTTSWVRKMVEGSGL